MAQRSPSLTAFLAKELRHILRDRQTLLVILLLPLAQVIVFGFALRTDVNNVRVAFVEPVSDEASAALRARFAGNGRFDMLGAYRSAEALETLLRRGEVDVAVVLEAGFGEKLSRGTPAQILLISDASDPNTGSRMQAYASAVVVSFAQERRVGTGLLRIELQTRMRFNPTLESVNLFVPGLIALVLTLISAMMTAISLSREKERGTLEILLVSPLRPWQIIAGKVAPYLLLALANVTSVLVAAWIVFKVPFRGSLFLLLAASILYSLVGLALGVFIAARTSSQRAATLGALVGTMLPSTLLSGMIFPIASLPGWLQPVTTLIPARWFIVISRGIMLKGVGLDYLWQELAILAAMFALLMLAAIRSFKPRLA